MGYLSGETWNLLIWKLFLLVNTVKSQVDLIKEFAGHVEEKKTFGDTLEMK